jgi:hypothetical protein
MVIPKRYRFPANCVDMFPRCLVSIAELSLENEYQFRVDQAVVSTESTSKAA